MGLGSEIRYPGKIYSGSRIQGLKGTGSLIRIRKAAFFSYLLSGKPDDPPEGGARRAHQVHG
jgi:hypothetical protein